MSSGVDRRAVVVAEMERIDEQIAALTRSCDEIVETATAGNTTTSTSDPDGVVVIEAAAGISARLQS